MDLIAGGPTHAAQARVELGQNFSNRLRRVDRNEKTFRDHLPERIAAPDFASFPLWLTRGGNLRLNIFITRANRFGQMAFAAMMK